MPRLPVLYAPIVRLRREGRHVLLVAWRRRASGIWEAHVAWLQRVGVAQSWRPVETWLPAKEVEKVKGEDYRDVPREYYEPPGT